MLVLSSEMWIVGEVDVIGNHWEVRLNIKRD